MITFILKNLLQFFVNAIKIFRLINKMKKKKYQLFVINIKK